MTDERLQEIEAHFEQTGDELTAVIKRGCKFSMRVPAEDTDFDLLVGRSLTFGRDLLAALKEERAENQRLRNQIQQPA